MLSTSGPEKDWRADLAVGRSAGRPVLCAPSLLPIADAVNSLIHVEGALPEPRRPCCQPPLTPRQPMILNGCAARTASERVTAAAAATLERRPNRRRPGQPTVRLVTGPRRAAVRTT